MPRTRICAGTAADAAWASYYLGELARFEARAAEGLKEAEDRGSVYAATTLRTGLANVVWLLRDDPTRARAEVDEAMQRWVSRGYHVQHWYELIARTQIDLYTGDAQAGWARLEREWPALRRSGLLRLQHTRIVATHLEARAAVAAAAATSDAAARRRLLAIAQRCARKNWAEGDGWNRILAAATHAQSPGERGRPGGRAAKAQRETVMRFFDRVEQSAQHHLPVHHHREVIGHTLDLIQHMRREENSASFVNDRSDDRFQDVAAHDRVEAGTRFIEQQQFRPVGQREQQPCLRAFAARQAFDFGRRIEAKLSAQLLSVSRVPLRIKRLRIAQQFVHAHPERQIALLGKVANATQNADRVRDRVEAKHAYRAVLRLQQAEDVFDEGRFARAVFTDQSKDHAARNAE